ncbi:uncharacterized protein [Engystomops pustulosus]|uniref:uncharacterized protein n=1 Tax=Engystomops pustulosus TaxID=76066 RepID=UPI003AFA3D55
MQESPELSLLNKSSLFLPLPIDPKSPNGRYVQCPATGQVYCMSTGSIYLNSSQIDPLPTSISSLNERKDSKSFSGNPSSCTMKKSLNTRSSDKPADSEGAITVPNIKKNTNEDQAVKNDISKTQSNKAPYLINAGKQMQDALTIPNNQSNSIAKNKNEYEPVLDSTVSTNSPNVKSNSKAAKRKHKNRKKKDKKTKMEKSQQTQELLYTSSIKNSLQLSKSKTEKQNNSTLLPLIKPTTSILKKSSNTENPTQGTWVTTSALRTILKPVIKKQSKKEYNNSNNSGYNPVIKPKKKSFRYYITYLKPMTEPMEPIKIDLSHLLFPQSAPPFISGKKFPRNSKSTFPPPSSNILMNRCSSKPAAKPSLYLSRKDHEMINFEKKIRKKTNRSKASVKKFNGFTSVWRFLKPFNRKPHHHFKKKRRSLQGQYKNCIMASSVYEIIHSRFAKNTNEHMPASQIRTLLSTGVRKLRKRQRWVRLMEEEAIEKYKNMIFVKNKQKLDVEYYDVLHHPEKSWLVSYGRWVINHKSKECWPLLVRCLHKYPDSTLREACKHRSFCLKWDGTSYTLRVDHAYYTQIQCHMAVTDTSFAELIVHTHKEMTVLPVYFDTDFWKKTEVTLETFFTTNILPFLKKAKNFSYLKKQPRRKNVRILGIPECYT